MMLAVEVRDLVKYYGRFQALKGITFSFEEGMIYGLIGKHRKRVKKNNGIDKSTSGEQSHE